MLFFLCCISFLHLLHILYIINITIQTGDYLNPIKRNIIEFSYNHQNITRFLQRLQKNFNEAKNKLNKGSKH